MRHLEQRHYLNLPFCIKQQQYKQSRRLLGGGAQAISSLIPYLGGSPCRTSSPVVIALAKTCYLLIIPRHLFISLLDMGFDIQRQRFLRAINSKYIYGTIVSEPLDIMCTLLWKS
jgi:hypothetical protein